MAPKTTEDLLRDIIVEQLGVAAEQVTSTSRFNEDFSVDSLDTIEITMAIEEEFNIEIFDPEFDDVGTFGRLVELVKKKAAPAARRTTAG